MTANSELTDGLPFSGNSTSDEAVITSENTPRQPEREEPGVAQSLAHPAPAVAGAVATSGARCRCGAEQDLNDPSRCTRKHMWKGFPGPALRTGRYSALLAEAPTLPADWRAQTVRWGYQHITNVNQALAARPSLARSMRWLRQWRELVKDVHELVRELERDDAAARRTTSPDTMSLDDLEAALRDTLTGDGTLQELVTDDAIIARVLGNPGLRRALIARLTAADHVLRRELIAQLGCIDVGEL